MSFAGPLANLALAILFIVLSAMFYKVIPPFSFTQVGIAMLRQGILINLVLFTFNLLPFPPLDGSKMLSVFMDYETARKYEGLQRYAMLFFIVLIMTNIFSYIVSPVILAGNMTLNWLIQVMG